MKSNLALWLFMLVSVLLLPASHAADDLMISQAIVREGPPTAPALAGYVTIKNAGADDDRLVSVTTSFAKRTDLHDMKMADGVMTMTPADDGFAVPAGESLELKQGGMHIMFMMLTKRPKAGDQVDVTLTFERAGSITVPFTVTRIVE